MTQQGLLFPGDGAGARERKPTRTIAILARSASKTHRLAIQTKISSNGFSILSERLEEWTLDDQDFLHEFLRDEAADDGDVDADREESEAAMARWIRRLTVGPIYVMVLERYRAAELWRDMMGPDLDEEDDDSSVLSVGKANGQTMASQGSALDSDGLPIPRTGLRAQYGAGALYGSPPWTAERQLAICFPELASPEALDALHAEASMLVVEDEPRMADRPGSVAGVGRDGSFVVREDDDIVYDEAGQAFDAHNGEPLELQSEILMDRSRESINASPETKRQQQKLLAALGQGSEGKKIFRARPLPASTMKASTQPRLSRAAALRMGIPLPEVPKRTASVDAASQESASHLGISGLPRAEVKLPRSLQKPSVAPRLNKAAVARTGGSVPDSSPTVPKTRKPIDFSSTPGHKRLSNSGPRPASLAAPSVAPRLNKAATARQSMGGGTALDVRPSPTRASSHASQSSDGTRNAPLARKPVDFSNTPGHKRHSMVGTGQLKSLQAPSVTPRANKASVARLAGGNMAPAESLSPSSSPAKTPQSRARAASALGTSRASLSSAPTSASETADKERKPIDFSNTPGHKRTSNSFSVASLQKPTITPRSNAAAARRLSVGGVGAAAALASSLSPSSVKPASRPASSLAVSGGGGGRPLSRMSSSGPHQDGAVHPSSTARSAQSRIAKAPPSSYRFP